MIEAQPVIPFDGFGVDVDIDGNTAVVGAMNHNGHGAAYVFEYNTTNFTWEFQDKLEPSDGVSGDRFGERLALSGDKIAVGSRNSKVGAGAVYLFKRTGVNWTQQHKVSPVGINPGDGFGQDVAMHGDTVVATSLNHYNGTPGHTGAAWTFKVNADTLQEMDKLSMESFEWNFGDNFGIAVEMDDKHILVGAHRSTLSGIEAGAVIPWRATGGSYSRLHAVLPDTTGAIFSQFGAAIEIVPGGDRIVVGAAGYNGLNGIGHEFEIIGDVIIGRTPVESEQPGFAPGFGISVCAFPGIIVVGANYGTIPGITDSGSAEVFEPCDEGEIGANVNWTGTWLESQEFFGDEYTWYRLNTTGGDFPYPEVVGSGMNYQPTGSGTFLLKIFKNDCYTITTITISPVGVEEAVTTTFSIVPNPATASVTIQTDQKLIGTGTIQNLQGKVVSTFAVDSDRTLDVSDLTEGGLFPKHS